MRRAAAAAEASHNVPDLSKMHHCIVIALGCLRQPHQALQPVFQHTQLQVGGE